jgi:hypothetical protein
MGRATINNVAVAIRPDRPETSRLQIVLKGVARDVKGRVEEAVDQVRSTRKDVQIVQVLIHERAPLRLADEMHRGAKL